MRTFHAAGGAGDDPRTGGDGACQRNQAYFGVIDQRFTDAWAATKQNVDDTGGEQLSHDPRQFQSGQWGLLGGLEHHAVAGSQGRGKLPGDHHQWVVPGRDGGHYTEWITANHRGVPWQVFTAGRARQAAAGTSEKAEDVGNGRDFVVQRRLIRLAAVQ
ncbi:hypothetical protein D3C84_935770 [compost metagenome]